MSNKTSISYADHTWSPWLGCEPVSPGCAHCYASAISKRAGRGEYRHGIERIPTKDRKKPVRWNRRLICDCGQRQIMPFPESGFTRCPICDKSFRKPRVLVSMCDPFDSHVPFVWFDQFMELIVRTPSLNWLLLTKRIQNAASYGQQWAAQHDYNWTGFPPNLWLGVSVETQAAADERIQILLNIPARVHWVSYEPALGRVWLTTICGLSFDRNPDHSLRADRHGIDWVVAGGESGPGHREMDLAWITSMAYQCKIAGVPFYCKQDSHRLPGQQGRIPDDLWAIKEFPKV